MCNIVLVRTKSIHTSLNEKTKKIKLFTPHKESLVPFYYTNAFQSYESMLCPIKFFHWLYNACNLLTPTFSAFQMSILLLQFELNVNSFLYLNKNLQS